MARRPPYRTMIPRVPSGQVQDDPTSWGRGIVQVPELVEHLPLKAPASIRLDPVRGTAMPAGSTISAVAAASTEALEFHSSAATA